MFRFTPDVQQLYFLKIPAQVSYKAEVNRWSFPALAGTNLNFQLQQMKSNSEKGKETLVIEQRDDMRVMTFLRPMIASSDYKGTNCLGCHMAKEGDVLGVVRISYSLKDIDQAITKNAMVSGFIMAAIFAAMFVVLGYIFKNLFC